MDDKESESTPPIVIDLGAVKKKRIRQLREGRGPLVSEVDQVMSAVRRELGEEAEQTTLVPVVMVYRRKRKKRRLFDW